MLLARVTLLFVIRCKSLLRDRTIGHCKIWDKSARRDYSKMKQRKRILAVLLAAAMAFGSPGWDGTSRVHAEGAATQQEQNGAGVSSGNAEAAGAANGSAEAAGAANGNAEAAGAEAAGAAGSVSGGEALASVSGGNARIALLNTNAPIEKGVVDLSGAISSGLPAQNNNGEAINYGNAAIGIYLTNDIGYKADARTIDSVAYTYAVQMKGNGSVAVAEDGNVTASNAIKVTANRNGTISFVMYKMGNAGEDKKLHFQCLENNTLEEYEGYGVLFTKHQTHTFTVEAGKTYYLWAENAKAQIYAISYTYEGEQGIDFPEGIPAFPGAEGGGKYASGGRGGDVYVVTNLDDDGEGSLRYGIDNAPAAGRIIVFDIGGTINLKSTLTFKDKSNITIAGQTAPGDGITIAGYDTNISNSQNIIIRFVRFRVGTENLLRGGDSMDALWGRDNDTFILDHCTFSWNTDETLSTYRGKNGTVQWCIISESLTVSGHSKGRHGYGAIWGGDNTVFQYNLLADHTSRNPRIGGGSMTDPTNDRSYATLQVSNNVLYNHGYFACYGGGFAYTNYINNYIKPGPGTRESLADTLITVGENGKDGGFYVNGNILEGNDAITADNSLGIKESASGYISESIYTPSEENPDAFSNVTLRSAADSYDLVLANAGATYPYRDAVDARIVAHVKTDTGAYINVPDEVGGYPARTVTAAEEGRIDTDGDGIPDEWETAHGLNPNDQTDSCLPASNDKNSANYGYAWIEVYFNELVKDVVVASYEAPNPTVSIDLADNTLADQGTPVTVTATAAANNGGSIAKVEFYNGSELVATVQEAPYSYAYAGLDDGTYNISVRAYDNEGNATQSDPARLHINSTAGTGDWTSTDVGNPGVKGTASLESGVLTVKGAGKLGKSEGSVAGSELNNAASDDFQFVYQKLTGDAELIAHLDSYTAVDNHTFNGLMFRESLDEDAAAVAVGLTMTKIWDGYDTVWTAFMVNRAAKGGSMTEISETIDGSSAAQAAGIPILSNLTFKSGNTFNGTWLKLTRIGDDFTAAVSNDGLVWQTIGRLNVKLPETAYVGFAVEAGKAANDLENYATAKFSDIKVNRAFGKITYELENVDYSATEQFALGEDVVITLSSIRHYLLPETVEVTVGGKKVEGVYNKETGVITLKNLMGDVVVRAQGVKRPVVPVSFEKVDPAELLTVEETAGGLLLTQSATSGATSSGSPAITDPENSQYPKASQNESWILFPEVNQLHQLSMKITIKELLAVGNDNTGVFIGVFDTDTEAFSTLGFRPCKKTAEAVSKFWTKKDKTGNGGTKKPIAMNEEYTVNFTYDKNGQYYVQWESESGGSWKETFKANENFLQKGDAVRYGIGLIGATVEISELKLIDHEDNVIYYQNAADYSAVTEAIRKASQLTASDYEDFSAVQEAWDAIVLGLPADRQAEVDAMAAALENAMAALVKKQITGIAAVEVSTTLPETLLTDAVKSKTGCTSIEDLLRFMQNTVKKDAFAAAETVVVDVKVKVSFDGGVTWQDADETNFPADGVDVLLSYPTGTNRTDYDFLVSHLITMACNGQQPGTVEYPAVEALDGGLKLHIMSASPFAVAWKQSGSQGGLTPPVQPTPTPTPAPANNDDDDEQEEAPATQQTGENIVAQATKTGDSMNVAAVVCGLVLAAALAGAGALVYVRRRREKTGAADDGR